MRLGCREVQAWLRKLRQHRRTPSECGGAEKDAGEADAGGAAGAGCEHEERVGRVLTEWLVHYPSIARDLSKLDA